MNHWSVTFVTVCVTRECLYNSGGGNITQGMERTWLLISILVFCIRVSVNGFWKTSDKGSITVKPQYAIVGEYVNITCNSTKGADNFTMKINEKLVNATHQNKNIIWFTFKSEEPKKFTIICQHPNIMPGAGTLEFGYLPDFNYSFERDINRNILLFLIPNSHQSNDYWKSECLNSKTKTDWDTCNMTKTNVTAYTFYTNDRLYYKFNMSSSNSFGKVKKSKMWIKEDIPFRLPPLRNITFQYFPSASPFQQTFNVQLIHIPSVDWNAYKLKYEIKYWSEYDNMQIGKTQFSKTNSLDLKMLLPYTTYYVTARVKRGENGFWSPPITKNFKTATAPASPPRTTNGSYVWNCSTTALKTCVIIYWEKIPHRLVNGKLKGYCVQIIDRNHSVDHCQDPEFLTTNSLSKMFTYQPSNKPVTFSIAVINNNKGKPQTTILQVKERAPESPKAVYVIKTGNNIYNVSWLLHPHQEIINVTVFSCLREEPFNSNMLCKDDVKWNTVANGTYLLVNNSLEAPAFAVYVNTEDGFSPLTKAECIFVPGRPKKPNKPETLVSENKVTIVWPKFSCNDLNGIPVAYEILYNKSPFCDKGHRKVFKPIGIKPPEISSTIESLDPETNYSVCIRVVTEEHTSLMSDTVSVMTKASKTDNTLAIVLGLIAAFTAVVLMALCIYCFRRTNRYKKNIKIETPTQNLSGYNHIDYSPSCNGYATININSSGTQDNSHSEISSSNPWMNANNKVGNLSDEDSFASPNTTTTTTTTTPVSSLSTPTDNGDYSENTEGGPKGNPEHHEVHSRRIYDNDFENPRNFNKIHENSFVANKNNQFVNKDKNKNNSDNLSNCAVASDIKGIDNPIHENVETEAAFSMEEEAVNNLVIKNNPGFITEAIELNNIPEYVVVGDTLLSTQTSSDNFEDENLLNKYRDFPGDSTTTDIIQPSTNASDLNGSMLHQPPTESEDSKSIDNTDYVTAECIVNCGHDVSSENLFHMNQTPTDITQEPCISTKGMNSTDDSKNNCSFGYIMVENVPLPHPIAI